MNQNSDLPFKQPVLILVSGLAASGKTFIGQQIAANLGLPLISKDTIKETLYDALDLKSGYDSAMSRKLTAVTMTLMFRLAAVQLKLNRSCVIESTFHSKFSTPDILALSQSVSFYPIQVLCFADGAVIVERFKDRINSGQRHPAHLDAEAINDPGYLAKLASGRDEIMDIGGQVIEVNTTDFEKVDLKALFRLIHRPIAQK